MLSEKSPPSTERLPHEQFTSLLQHWSQKQVQNRSLGPRNEPSATTSASPSSTPINERDSLTPTPAQRRRSPHDTPTEVGSFPASALPTARSSVHLHDGVSSDRSVAAHVRMAAEMPINPPPPPAAVGVASEASAVLVCSCLRWGEACAVQCTNQSAEVDEECTMKQNVMFAYANLNPDTHMADHHTCTH